MVVLVILLCIIGGIILLMGVAFATVTVDQYRAIKRRDELGPSNYGHGLDIEAELVKLLARVKKPVGTIFEYVIENGAIEIKLRSVMDESKFRSANRIDLIKYSRFDLLKTDNWSPSNRDKTTYESAYEKQPYYEVEKILMDNIRLRVNGLIELYKKSYPESYGTSGPRMGVVN